MSLQLFTIRTLVLFKWDFSQENTQILKQRNTFFPLKRVTSRCVRLCCSCWLTQNRYTYQRRTVYTRPSGYDRLRSKHERNGVRVCWWAAVHSWTWCYRLFANGIGCSGVPVRGLVMQINALGQVGIFGANSPFFKDVKGDGTIFEALNSFHRASRKVTRPLHSDPPMAPSTHSPSMPSCRARTALYCVHKA